MHHAVEAPRLGTITLGAALVLVALFEVRPAHPVGHRLALHAPKLAGAVYLSAWRDGDVRVTGTAAGAITFRTRASVSDGCRWMGIETLVPIDAHSYRYSYDEAILACDPGAVPCTKTPRTGIVTVEE